MIKIIKNLKNKLIKQFYTIKGENVGTVKTEHRRYKKDVRLPLTHMMTLVYLKSKLKYSLNAILRSAVHDFLEYDSDALSEIEPYIDSCEKKFPPSSRRIDRVSIILSKDDMDKLAKYVKKKGVSYSKVIRAALTFYLILNYGEIFDR